MSYFSKKQKLSLATAIVFSQLAMGYANAADLKSRQETESLFAKAFKSLLQQNLPYAASREQAMADLRCGVWQADHKLGRDSLMAGRIAPLPFQPSPFSSSKAKQLG